MTVVQAVDLLMTVVRVAEFFMTVLWVVDLFVTVLCVSDLCNRSVGCGSLHDCFVGAWISFVTASSAFIFLSGANDFPATLISDINRA